MEFINEDTALDLDLIQNNQQTIRDYESIDLLRLLVPGF
jgi:hypothetical protein